MPLAKVTLFVLIILYQSSRESFEFFWVNLDTVGTIDRIRESPELPHLIFAYALFSFSWQGVVAFLATYLQFGKASAPTIASAGFALLFVVAIIVMPLVGRFSDQIPRLTVAMGGLLLGILGLFTLVVATSLLSVVLGIVVFSIGIRAYPPVMRAHIMDIVPDETTSGDFGAVKTTHTLFGNLGPVYVGFVSTWTTYSVAFGSLGACLGVSTLTLLWSSCVNRRCGQR